MTLDLDALEARLPEYDPEAPKCPKTVEDVRSYAPDHMEPDDPEYDDFKMVHRVPCCRPEGHEGECRSTRRLLGWPGYATLKELLAEVRRLRMENTALEAKLDASGQANLGLTYLARKVIAEHDLPPHDLNLTLTDPPLEMIQIPPPSGGSYSLISGEGETVAMPRPYWIGKYPVTLRVWRSVMGTSPSQAGGGDDAPVDSVSWHDAVQFCERLSTLFEFDGSTPDRAPFRLPTEAEWEWAASGGVREDRQVTPETGWYDDNSNNQSHPVGLKDPNAFGLYDTLGNVWEWTTTAEDSYRVNRGGSWYSSAQNARVARRGRSVPGGRYDGLGLRLLRG